METPRVYEWEPLAWLAIAAKWAMSIVIALWGGADTDIKILCVLASADVLVSLFVRTIPFLDLCRRLALTFILVGTVHYIYGIAKQQTGLNLGFDLSAVVSSFYCLGEAIVILKNCNAIGIRLPPALLDVLAKAEGLTGGDRRDIIALRLKQDQGTATLDVKMSQSKEDGPKIIKP